LKAAEDLAAKGLSTTVADMRFAKPIDTDLVTRLAAGHEVLITVEEGSRGGFGAHVLQYLSDEGALDQGLKVRTLCFPDQFVEHEKPDTQIAMARLTTEDIVATALKALGRGEEGAARA
jgi:1-deoxy-D-xylulose-5-phosphate synthase